MLTAPPQADQVVALTDREGRDIGTISVGAVRDDLLTGTFTPGADYPSVRQLFSDFEEAAEAQALSAVDRYGGLIDALEFRIRPPAATPVPVFDVQIWSDGGISCRLRPGPPPGSYAGAANGAPVPGPAADEQSARLP